MLPPPRAQSRREGAQTLSQQKNPLGEAFRSSLMSLLSHSDLVLRWICFPPTHVTANTDLTFANNTLTFINFIFLWLVERNGSRWTGGILLSLLGCGSSFPSHPFLIPSPLPHLFCLCLLVFSFNKLLFLIFSILCGHHQTEMKGKPSVEVG